MQNIRIACAGEALVDLIAAPEEPSSFKARLGGAVFNTAISLARQSVPAAYLNPLSVDFFGEEFRRRAGETKLKVDLLQRSTKPSALAIARIDRYGKADYSFIREGVADRDTNSDKLITATNSLAELEAFFCGCLALAPADSDIYLPWLRTAQASNLAVILDLNLRLLAFSNLLAYRNNIFAAMQYANLIKLSDEDLCGLLDLPVNLSSGELLSHTGVLFDKSACEFLLLTVGAQGAYLLTRDGGHWHAQERRTICLADTIGAGDSFMAGFLAFLLQSPTPLGEQLKPSQSERWLPALRHAVACASFCVEQIGCLAPSFETARAASESVQIQRIA